MGSVKLYFYEENKKIPWDTVVQITKTGAQLGKEEKGKVGHE